MWATGCRARAAFFRKLPGHHFARTATTCGRLRAAAVLMVRQQVHEVLGPCVASVGVAVVRTSMKGRGVAAASEWPRRFRHRFSFRDRSLEAFWRSVSRERGPRDPQSDLSAPGGVAGRRSGPWMAWISSSMVVAVSGCSWGMQRTRWKTHACRLRALRRAPRLSHTPPVQQPPYQWPAVIARQPWCPTHEAA